MESNLIVVDNVNPLFSQDLTSSNNSRSMPLTFDGGTICKHDMLPITGQFHSVSINHSM